MVADEIKKFFHGDVAVDDATLTKFSRDYSVFKVKPSVVVFPKDDEDVENLVAFVAKKKKAGENISLTGRSAGTDMTGGPLSQSIIISFTKYFNHIKEIKPFVARETRAMKGDSHESQEVGFVRVEPGVYFRDLEKELTAKQLLYPAYPASKDLCALGGMINNNSGGEKTLQYGKTEDYVRELTVVMADGKKHVVAPFKGAALKKKLAEKSFDGKAYAALYKLIEKNYKKIMAAKPDVSKNSAGYYLWNVWNRETGVFDPTKLFVGSQGTLGMLLEGKLGLVPRPLHSRMAVIFLQDLKYVGDLVEKLLPFKPESIESYDDKTIEVAVKLWRPLLKSMKGNVIKLGFDFLPEVFMALRHGMPKMVMLVEFSGDDEAKIMARLDEVKNMVDEFSATHRGDDGKSDIQIRILKSAEEMEKYWTIRRQSFALLHGAVKGMDTAPFIDDFIVKPEYMAEVLPKVNAILDKYKKDLIYTIAGHPGNGNFHIIPLMNLSDPRVRALIPKISNEVYKLVVQYHGSITAEHNDGIIRTPYLEEMYGRDITKLFADVKKIFDPLGIFNPGKKVGGTLKYAVEHIAATN